MQCSSCHFDNPPGMKFCGRCGGRLEAAAAADGGGAAEPEQAAELRQLTLLFCGLADATPLSERLEPEELREVLREVQAAAEEVVGRFDGHVAQVLGDGLLAYFGYPRAHEDDARRAVRAGLGLVEAVLAASGRLERSRGLRLAVRIGIHTGPVVTGGIGGSESREDLVLGQTPNLAARIRDLAMPNEVVLSAATYELVHGFFAARSLGAHKLKGISQPIEAFRVLEDSGISGRFEVELSQGMTPLVGRDDDLARLRGCFEQARDSGGQTVLVVGEAGIGKSRLVHGFRKSLALDPHGWWVCRCSPYTQHSAFHPIADLVGELLEVRREADDKLGELERGLAGLGLPLAEAVPLFAGLLSLPLGDRYPPLSLEPQRRKERLFELLLTFLVRTAADRPMVFVVEDLHWIDPTTLQFLELMVSRAAELPLLALLTCRPSFSAPWPRVAHFTELTLEPLAEAQARAVIAQQTAGGSLPEAVVEALVEKADGVPLFVEELTRTVLESDLLHRVGGGWTWSGDPDFLAIPTTLQDSLTARLDRLGGAKELAQLAAVLGRKLGYGLLHAVSRLDEPVLEEGLRRLVTAGILEQGGTPPRAAYTFRHALIQDAAYGSLLPSTRRRFHRRAARALPEVSPDLVARRPELLARHLSAAGLGLEAARRWLEAGRLALARSGQLEAIAELEKGLAALAALEPSAQRDRREIELQHTLGMAWAAVRGFPAPEAEQAYGRAFELCQRRADAPQLVWVLHGLWAVYFTRSSFARALRLGERMLELAEGWDDPDLLLMARFALGATLFHMGRLEAAQQHLERGLALSTGERDPGEGLLAIADQRVSAGSYAALVLWMRGFPDRAAEHSREAVARARRLGHPFSLCYALSFAAWLHVYRREDGTVRELAAELLTLAEEQGFFLAEWGDFFLDQADDSGRPKTRREHEPLRMMRRASETHTGLGLTLGQTAIFSLMAERLVAEGDVEKAQGAVMLGLAAVRSTGEAYWQGELHRLRGELLLAGGQGGEEQAEAAFDEALELARRQGARSLELRATVSLSRLWQQQGKRQQARERLAAVVDAFTEGYDTADLQQARSLLEALSTLTGSAASRSRPRRLR